MDTPTLIAAQLDAHPGEILPWLRRLALDLTPSLPPQRSLLVGPPTVSAALLTPYETAALYLAPRTLEPAPLAWVHHYPVVLAVTYVPLRHPRIGLEVRAWLPSPATLDVVLRHITGHFAHAHLVLSGVASSSPHGGAPPLPCNLWLASRLATGNATGDREQLYLAWLEQYRALRGDYPADPRRSFRGALATCRRRLRQG